MSNHPIIKVENLSKAYKLYDKPIDRLKEAINPIGKCYHKEFFALKNVSFNLQRGKTLGVIGKNGSGKSTLLKILSGVLTPTSGNVHVGGRVSALLELGAGFNPEMTGIENIYLNGTILGFSPEEIEEKRPAIEAFADIGEFINQPVKTYSSGMFVRLAFSIATSIDPQILIVDEALSVGDMFFQAKCAKRMENMINQQNVTLLFVSHEISAIKRLCEETIYLREGELIAWGPSGQICDEYVKDQRRSLGLFKANVEEQNKTQQATPATLPDVTSQECLSFESRVKEFRSGSQVANIIHAELFDSNHNKIELTTYGEQITARILYTSTIDLEQIVVGFYIRDMTQTEIIGTNNIYAGYTISNLIAGETYSAEFRFMNYLKAGTYNAKIILANALPTTQFYDLIENALVFRVCDIPGEPRWALYNPPMEFSNSGITRKAA